MKRIILGGLLTTVFTMNALSQSGSHSGSLSPYSQYGLGVLSDQAQVAVKGMAGTGIAMRGGTFVNTLNPASYSAVDSLTMLFDAGLSGQFINFKEGANSVNARSADFDYAVGLFRVMPHLGVSFGVQPFSDIGYTYTSSLPLSSTLGSIVETHSGSGGFHQAFIGAGWNPIEPLSIGFNAAYLWGTYDRSVASTATTEVNSLTKTYKASVNSYNLTLGMQWAQSLGKKDVVTLGATVGLGHKLGADATCSIVNLNTSTLVSDTTEFVAANGLELPLSYGVGLAWTHRQSLTVAADISQQKWGKVKFPDYDELTRSYRRQSGLLTDRTRLSLGVDYVPHALDVRSYLKRIHYRIGISHTTPYYKINGHDGPKQFAVSAGLGLPLQNAWNHRSVLNVSAQWERTSATDFITDNTFRISVGLTFNERWFAKWRID